MVQGIEWELDDVSCRGHESSLLECDHDCYHSENSSVRCSAKTHDLILSAP